MWKVCICIFLGLVSQSITLSNAVEQQGKYFVDPGVTLVENWDGWGTSLAWWSEVLGGLDEPVIKNVTRLFFHPDNLNLNIVRYVIGGTTPNETVIYPCGDYRPGAATESYKDGPGQEYNWTRDARQRDILLRAKELGANTFEAFSNSPPQWLTISGCSKGNPFGGLLHSNFAADKADEFVDYATDVINHFHEHFGITFTTYVPFNEPYGLAGVGSWFGASASQEGCNMNRPVMAAVVQSLHKAITDKNMSFVSITTADETQVSTALQTQEFLRGQGLSNMISKVNVHGYWDIVGNRRDLLSILCHQEGHRLWMDEMGWGGNVETDMTQGLAIANRIVKDVRYMLPSAWVYWQVMEDVGGWGLIRFPYNDGHTVEDIQFNSGYYSMMQFSKYIKQGYRIIYSSDEDSIAAMDKESKTVVIVTINNSNETSIIKRFDLRLLSSIGKVSGTRTSATQTNVIIDNIIVQINNQSILEFEATPESITTLVLSDITLGEGSKTNRIQNGDFESEELMWDLESSIKEDGGVNSKFPWRGNKSGFLGSIGSISENRKLFQVVNIPGNNTKTVQLFLTAWCSTSGSNTKLMATIMDSSVAEVDILGGQVYRMYSLSFKAVGGDAVKIHFSSSSGLSYIDNVVLHYEEVEPESDLEEKDRENGSLNKVGNYDLVLSLIIVVNMFINYI